MNLENVAFGSNSPSSEICPSPFRDFWFCYRNLVWCLSAGLCFLVSNSCILADLMRVEILSLAFRMISSSSIGVPSTPNFVKAMRINFQNMKCIIEIPCGRTLPVERTPSRLSVLSSQCWELSSSRSALNIGVKRGHSPKWVIVSFTRLHMITCSLAIALLGCVD